MRWFLKSKESRKSIAVIVSLIVGISSLLYPFVSNIISSLVASRLQEQLDGIISIANNNMSFKVWEFVCILSACLLFSVLIVSLIVLIRGNIRGVGIGSVLNQLLQLDDFLLDVLTIFCNGSNINKDKAVKRILLRSVDFFESDFGYCEGEIYLHNGLDTLISCIHSEEEKEEHKEVFSLSEGQECGIVGITYLTKTVQRVEVLWNKRRKRWIPNREEYRLTKEREYKGFPFQAIIAAPLVDSKNCSIGVVCFYGININTFDSDESKDFVLKFAKRISAALMIAALQEDLQECRVGNQQDNQDNQGVEGELR